MGKKIIGEFHFRVKDSELGHGSQVDRLAGHYRGKNSLKEADDDACVEMALGHINFCRQWFDQVEGEFAESMRVIDDEGLAEKIVESLIETGSFKG
jgi:hypothetical protein